MSLSHRPTPARPRPPRPLLGLALCGACGLGQAALQLPATSVDGTDSSGYRPSQASVGGFESAALLDTPASITVIDQ